MLFLTGGTGLLGLHIIDELRARSLPVTALVRDDDGARAMANRGARPVKGRVENAETWKQVHECSAIIHGAAIIAGRYSWDQFREVNVEGTRLAAERARHLGVPLLHISSVSVYGSNFQPERRVDEAFSFAPLRDHDYYARSKRMAEEVVWQESTNGLRAIVFRPCVVYGEGDRLFLPRLVRTVIRSWGVPLIGGGSRPLSLVHARNVAQAIVLAVSSRQAWGQAYNVTNDDQITARELVEAIGRGAGKNIRTISVPPGAALAVAKLFDGGRRLLGPSRYPGSMASAVRFWRGGNPYTSDKARRDLGWSPSIRHTFGIENATRFILSKG
jgi:nucleoside-diphosphate-sugar epimerase